jgi:hypothetical protein
MPRMPVTGQPPQVRSHHRVSVVVHAQLDGENGGGGWGRERHLPAVYVREHVTLAYAQTAHAAEGRTADTAHVLVDPSMDRAALYVGLPGDAEQRCLRRGRG